MSAQRQLRGIPDQSRSDKRKSVKGASHMGIFSNIGQHCRNLILNTLLEISALTLCIAHTRTKNLWASWYFWYWIFEYLLDVLVCFWRLLSFGVIPPRMRLSKKTTLFFSLLNLKETRSYRLLRERVTKPWPVISSCLLKPHRSWESSNIGSTVCPLL